MRSSSSRWVVVAVLGGGAVVVAVLLAQQNPLPRRFGVVLAAGAFASGAGLGVAGYVPIYVGIASYGIAGAIKYVPPPTGGDSRAAGIWLCLTIIPALAAVPTLAGVIGRRLVLVRRRRA